MSKYILITGGGFLNKGAESMTFTAVNEIRQRFPNREIILISESSFNLDDQIKEKYSFEVLPMNIGINFMLMGGIYKYIWKLKSSEKFHSKYHKTIKKFEYILQRTDLIIDISGYTLSSQRNYGAQILYLYMIKLAKKYNINMYLMPQSFGPFNYQGKLKYVIDLLIRKYMPYPKKIFARENEGYDLLVKKFNLKNIIKSYDLVLMNKHIDTNNIYKNNPELLGFDIINGVGIIPNMRNFDHGKTEEILELYDAIIENLIKKEKNIYLIRHSEEDIEACNMIKQRFFEQDNVRVIAENMSCLEIDILLKKFEFIIASRYHSIVHAYKNGVPCIALGWATKYHELLKAFNQELYLFDVRDIKNNKSMLESIDIMLNNHTNESKKIKIMLNKLQQGNVFDVLEEN